MFYAGNDDDEVEVEEGSISRPVSKTKVDTEKPEEKADITGSSVKDSSVMKTIGKICSHIITLEIAFAKWIRYFLTQ